MPELPRGTVTFLFTDIEGSTRLWQQHHAAMVAAYARHDTILREAVGAQGGTIYKTIGDAFQIAFPTAPDAVAAALAAQRALTGEDWSTHGLPEPLRVRMALHTGAVDPDPDGDYRSPVLNRLGRLLGAGHGGQVLLSAVTYELVRDHLPSGVTLRDLGAQRLKDLYRPEQVYQLVGRGVLAAFPPLRTLDTRPNNLPLQPTPFIGREQVVSEARSVLANPDVRLLTLTGPGGMGKTRLGLQVAADLLDAFRDGVFVVELAALTDPALVPSAIATTLGVQEAGDRSLTALLTEYLRDQQLLLVLDNFEQIVEAALVVAELLAGCRDLKILVTSRVRLGLRGEREYPVPPLDLPRRKPPPTTEQLGQYEAVRLFLERAQDARPTFGITNANAPAVAEICHRLDGLPLAIELAAARIKLFPPEALLVRLESRLRVLTGGARDLPERQRTLRGTIAWSYELLTSDEQALFRRLSVFAGGCSLEAIEAVTAADELNLDVFDGLERLVDQSLLRQTEATGEPRFGMLETIREYGLDQLGVSGEANEVHQRHADYFLSLATASNRYLMGSEQSAWLDRLDLEWDNLRAALDWLGISGSPGTALELATELWRYWEIRGQLREARTRLETSLDRVSAKPTMLRARALNNLGNILLDQGELFGAVNQYEAALTIRRQLGDQEGIADTLNNLGLVALAQGDLVTARTRHEESLAIRREFDDPWGIALSLSNLGDVANAAGDYTTGGDLHLKALEIRRKLGEPRAIGYSTNNLGESALGQGDLSAATELFQSAIGHLHMVGDWRGGALAFQNLGLTTLRTKAYGEAARALANAYRLRIDLQDHRGAMETLGLLVQVATAAGELERARKLQESTRLTPGSIDSYRSSVDVVADLVALLTTNREAINPAPILHPTEA